MTFGDIQELPVLSLWLVLLRDLVKFMTENNDSQANVGENIESKVVAKFTKHEKLSGMALQVLNSLLSAFLSGTPFCDRLFTLFSKKKKLTYSEFKSTTFQIQPCLPMKTFIGLVATFSYCLETA